MMVILFAHGFLCYGNNESVNASVHKRLQIDYFFIKSIIGNGDNHVVISLCRNTFYALNDICKKMIDDLGNNYGDGFRGLVSKIERNAVGFIIVQLGKCLNLLPCL